MNPIIKPVRILIEKLQTVLKVLMINPAAEKMEYFSSILVELRQLGEFYSRAFPEFIESTKQNTARVLYVQGGDCVHRGIFCPSPVLNMIVGCNKGVKISSPEAATDNYYKYRFDKADDLISISHYDFKSSKDIPDTIEFIVRQANLEYGITFHSGWKEVSNISKSVFRDGLLENYSVADYDYSTPEEMYLHYEDFTYENDLLVKADVYFGISPELDMFNLDTFHLSYESLSDLSPMPGELTSNIETASSNL